MNNDNGAVFDVYAGIHQKSQQSRVVLHQECYIHQGSAALIRWLQFKVFLWKCAKFSPTTSF